VISVSAPTVTQPTCGVSSGTIVVNAMTSTGTLEYSIDNGNSYQADSSFSSLSPGNYILKVRAQGSSCAETYASNPVVINAQPATPLPTASNTGPYQEGQKIDFNATGGSSYSWTGPNGFFSTLQNPAIASAKPLDAGIYRVTVSAANNCSATASTMVGVGCTSQTMNYYLVYADENPQIISPLVQNLQVQATNRRMSVIAVSACEQPTIKSVILQLSGTTNLKYYVDNNMPFALHETANVTRGDVLPPNHYGFIGRGFDQENGTGNLLTGPDVIGFDVVWYGREIKDVLPLKTEICSGSSFSVSASPEANKFQPFGGSNLFQVYLSDKNGSFSERTLIGSGSNPADLVCNIPNYIPGGSEYKIMVSSTEPVVSSLPSITSISIIGNDLSLKSATDNINSVTKNHQGISTIRAENKLVGQAKSNYTAGRFIELNPGFSIEASAVFEAKIEDICQNNK
jgi:hypothetical protein